MTTPEDGLRAAARTIGQMPDTELQRKLSEFRLARDARSQLEVYQRQAELDSLDGDQAAYELATKAEAAGDLRWAARWYRAAAMNDFADAAFRLAKTLDALAEQHLHQPASHLSAREEVDLVMQACRWYGDAYAAGELEAADLMDKLLARHFCRPEAWPALVVADDVDPGPPSTPATSTPLRPVNRRAPDSAKQNRPRIFER